MARRINEMEEVEKSFGLVRDTEKNEYIRMKEYSSKLVELLNLEKANARELEERSTSLAAECLDSVPVSRLNNVEEELRVTKANYSEINKRHYELQKTYNEYKLEKSHDESCLAVVREELHRTNAELNQERNEKGRVLEEHQKLRTYSEAREKEATDLKIAFHRGGDGEGREPGLKTDSSNSGGGSSRRSSTTNNSDGKGKGKSRVRSVDFSETSNI